MNDMYLIDVGDCCVVVHFDGSDLKSELYSYASPMDISVANLDASLKCELPAQTLRRVHIDFIRVQSSVPENAGFGTKLMQATIACLAHHFQLTIATQAKLTGVITPFIVHDFSTKIINGERKVCEKSLRHRLAFWGKFAEFKVSSLEPYENDSKAYPLSFSGSLSLAISRLPPAQIISLGSRPAKGFPRLPELIPYIAWNDADTHVISRINGELSCCAKEGGYSKTSMMLRDLRDAKKKLTTINAQSYRLFLALFTISLSLGLWFDSGFALVIASAFMLFTIATLVYCGLFGGILPVLRERIADVQSEISEIERGRHFLEQKSIRRIEDYMRQRPALIERGRAVNAFPNVNCADAVELAAFELRYSPYVSIGQSINAFSVRFSGKSLEELSEE